MRVLPGRAVLLMACCTSVGLCQRTSIAVSDLLAQGIEASAANLISDRLRSELFETGRFTVLERGQMDEILKEQGFQQKGCVSEQCAVEVGQLLGVSHMVFGTIGQVGRTYTLNVRLIDVATGQTSGSATSDCKCEIDDVLKESTRNVARTLADRASSSIESGQSAATQQVPATVEPDSASPAIDSTNASAGAADAVRKTGVSQHSRAGWVVRILSAVVAVGAGACGAYFNGQVSAHVDDAATIEQSTTSANFDSKAVEYAEEYELAEQSVLLRNLSYGVAALGVVGFGVSFAF